MCGKYMYKVLKVTDQLGIQTFKSDISMEFKPADVSKVHVPKFQKWWTSIELKWFFKEL